MALPKELRFIFKDTALLHFRLYGPLTSYKKYKRSDSFLPKFGKTKTDEYDYFHSSPLDLPVYFLVAPFLPNDSVLFSGWFLRIFKTQLQYMGS